MKLDKRHKWASHEDGELVFYECVICGEERTETVLAKQLRESLELLRQYTFVPELPDQPGKMVTFKRFPRLELPT